MIATGTLLGVREGTLAAALCVGLVVQLALRVLQPVRSVEKAVALAEDAAPASIA